MRLLLSTIPILLLTACSNSSNYSEYMGYWQQDNVKSDAKVAKIYQDGDTYLMDGNIYTDKSTSVRNAAPAVLTANEDKLSWSTGMGAVELGLSADNKKLYVSNNTFTKIDEAKANEIGENLKTCAELRDQYSTSIKDLKLFTDGYEAKKEQINAEFTEKLAPYKDVCRLPSGIKTNLG